MYFNVACAKRLPYQNEDSNSIIADKLIVNPELGWDKDDVHDACMNFICC